MADSTIDDEEYRLLLSGGGLRAMFGSVGVILYLMTSNRWERTTEIISVSGGSAANGALLTAGGFADNQLEDKERLHAFVRALVRDRVRPWRSWTRLMVLLGAAAIVGLLGALVAIAIDGRVAPWIVLVAGVAALPVALQLGRRLAAVYLRDVLKTALGVNVAERVELATLNRHLASRADHVQRRQHFIAASGLTTRQPYFFCVGGAAGNSESEQKLPWGYPIRPTSNQNRYTVDDAVFASSSLPLIGGVRSPRRSQWGDGHLYDAHASEELVDGGGNGIFGDQLLIPFREDAAALSSGPSDRRIVTIAVDTFRHPETSRRQTVARALTDVVRSKVSTVLYLISWTQLVTEALYVNDLVDVARDDNDITLLRLCEPSGGVLVDRPECSDDVDGEIDDMRKMLGSLELFGLSRRKGHRHAINGIAIGFIEAYLQFEGGYDGLSDALAEADELLGEPVPGHRLCDALPSFARGDSGADSASIDAREASPPEEPADALDAALVSEVIA